jgi:hypothetical protein
MGQNQDKERCESYSMLELDCLRQKLKILALKFNCGRYTAPAIVAAYFFVHFYCEKWTKKIQRIARSQ